MRVLLLSANTGQGHNSTASAIMEALKEENVTCDLQDTLAYLSARFSRFICAWHARLYKYSPMLVDKGYRAFERSMDPDETAPVYELLAFGAGKLWRTLTDENYDAVICVHVFAGMMMTEVRKAFGCKIPCYFVATDYTCSPTVEQCKLDGYFIPDSKLLPEFIRAGLPAEKLIASGIPVRQDFYRCGEREQARQQLGLPAQSPLVLVMCGSMGCGPIRKMAGSLLQLLPENATLVAICGSNEKLYEALSELSSAQLKVVGYTTKVSDYMDAADLIITKPGGLSTTEAANKHLPMVLFNTVGGCESRNFDFFLSNGYALGSDSPEEVVLQAVKLASDAEARLQMGAALEQAFTANSAQAMARYICASVRIDPTDSGHPSSKKGGDPMNQHLTITNLARSFAGESQARTRYTVYAQFARKEGYEWIARIFEETAANEAVHAEEFLEHLKAIDGCGPNIDLAAGYPFELGNTAENLAFAAAGELHEHDSAYPEFAEIARREGYDDTARLWMQIARIEGVHHNTFRQLHEQLASGTLTEKEAPITWRCLNCGYTYQSIRSCDPCPVCGKEAGWQEGELDSKMMMQKQ